ncbi:AraC family transcriptional regulator of adaptative response / DNA-3-methyladenine glycosylase II [Inhella inkyongensis]|uniref:DNA-3-methyladenine glycosylase II n=1 Tax=Inhella inkyongensis TaxID=392593 RepID=A0A840S5T3_9BURK|nr:Ada metal-binding domain-containing protein [Inhella inkyongensis]MBB5204164.1 AraC family transcriptional regulator of adaptative response / DNA-3-methyladenine glycosylase II [Inhella inkyongensis]
MNALRPLDPTACYSALTARDPRFDGHWFVGVSSTGVYCRPVCRVRTPKAANCSFYEHAAAAEAAGYRPCRKCRPELAPRAFSTLVASQQLAEAARERLDGGLDLPMTAVAEQLGVTDRHLRRIFQSHWGVSPLQYQQTQRLLLAKALLTDTGLPVGEVAARAGFGSTRAFQAAFTQHYRLSPLALRNGRRAGSGAARLELGYRPPYAVAELLRFLARRAVPGVESVDEAQGRIERAWPLPDGRWGSLVLQFCNRDRVELTLSPLLWTAPAAVRAGVRAWLDLDADPTAIQERLQAAGIEAVPGLRLPGCPDRFELGLRAILGQQVTVAAARTLATRLVERFGAPLPAGEALGPQITARLPSAAELAVVPAEALAALGLPLKRAQALVGLAQAWPNLAFAQRRGDPLAAEQELTQLAGIGPWTAAYLLMRGWPWPDRFLPGDVVLKNALKNQPALAPELSAPFRSYAVLQIWNATP